MILVDSSVWIEFFRPQRSIHQAYLSELIPLPEAIGVAGPVLQEVLQGIRDDEAFRRVAESLCRFPVVHPDTETYVTAARLYRTLTIKRLAVPPGDLTIAALAIQHGVELYTLDLRHVERVRAHSALRLHRPPR